MTARGQVVIKIDIPLNGGPLELKRRMTESVHQLISPGMMMSNRRLVHMIVYQNLEDSEVSSTYGRGRQ